MNSTLTFAQRLKAARKEAGLSQKDLADKLEVSDKAVSSYEVGRAAPPFKTLKKISKITNKPISYFDQDLDHDDVEIEVRLATIEQQLVEIKQLLLERKKDE